MTPVALEIDQVVDDVDRRRTQAEGDEGQESVEQKAGLIEPVTADQRQENEQVLGPLVQPDRLQPGDRACPRRHELALDVRAGTRRPADGCGGADHDRSARPLPHGEVVPGVARIVEAALAEALDERLGLGGAGQVRVAVADDDLVEQVEPCSDLSRVFAVGRRAEHGAAAGSPLRGHPGQQLFVQRQGIDVQIDPIGDAALQTRLAVEQPPGQGECEQRAVTEQLQGRLVQHVAQQQRAVEVDDQRHRGIVGGRRCHWRLSLQRRGVAHVCKAGAASSASERPNRRLSEIERSSG